MELDDLTGMNISTMIKMREEVQVYIIGSERTITEWLVLGPFPNPELEYPTSGKDYREGFRRDSLEDLGGEAEARITMGTAISYIDTDGSPKKATVQSVRANDDGIVDLVPLYQGKSPRLAYAACTVRSASTQKVFGYFGSMGSVKIWINGEFVFSRYLRRSRFFQLGEDFFTAWVRQGENHLLIKIEDSRRFGWAFRLDLLDSESRVRDESKDYRKCELMAFQGIGVEPAQGTGYLLNPGTFPTLDWADPALVREVMGEIPLHTRWYRVLWVGDDEDMEFEEVSEVQKLGPYLAVVEGIMSSGMKVCRGLSFYCVPEGWRPPQGELRAYIDSMPILESERSWDFVGTPFTKANWHEVIDTLDTPSTESPGGPEHAKLLTAFERSHRLNRPFGKVDEPTVVDGDLHAALRFKRSGKSIPARIAPPSRVDPPAPVLRPGAPWEAGMKPETVARLQELCERWVEAGGESFANLIARSGVVFFNEAYGDATADEPMWVASITKLLSALLFARFVDQGLLDYDDPVGKYLPDFPTTGEKAVTIRNLLDHTSGLTGQGNWGGIYNPYLHNVIANGIEYLYPGKHHMYGGMGYDLCGRVVEAITGRGVLRMMHEVWFDELGLENTTMGDLGGMAMSSANDLGRIGQMLLNHGSYGEKQFFRPEVLEKMMPQELHGIYPDLPEGLTWGMGIMWMRQEDPNAGKDGVPEDATLLSKNTIGHGSASSSIFRVDLDNGVVVIQTRNAGGEKNGEHAGQFYKIIHEGILPDG